MPREYTRDQLRRHIYGHWNPETSTTIWLENGTYRNLMRDLAYLRAHPKAADPSAILRLLHQMSQAWNEEREITRRTLSDMEKAMRDAIEVIKDDEREFERLEKLIDQLTAKYKAALREQERLQAEIDKIKSRDIRDKNVTAELRNELVEHYNRLAADPYAVKYAGDELQACRSRIDTIDAGLLSTGARQGLAVEGLAKLKSAELTVMRKRTEFDVMLTVVKQRAADVRDQLMRWRDLMFFDPDTRTHHIDLDFWSYGLFSPLVERFSAIEQRLEGCETRPGYFIDDLKAEAKDLSNIEQRGEEIVTEVINFTHLSEMLQAMGELAASVLCEDFGFALAAMGYNDDDCRSPFVLQMRNAILGCKVQFIFAPVEANRSLATYSMSFDEYIDEQLMASLIKDILEQLEYNNIKITRQRNASRSDVVDDITFAEAGKPISLPLNQRNNSSQK